MRNVRCCSPPAGASCQCRTSSRQKPPPPILVFRAIECQHDRRDRTKMSIRRPALSRKSGSAPPSPECNWCWDHVCWTNVVPFQLPHNCELGASVMPVNPKTVQGRRELTFQSLQDVLADVERLVASPSTRTLGNWSLAELLNHLTMTMNNSIDGFQLKAPFIIRLLGPFFKKTALKKISPGIKLPKAAEAAAYPPSTSLQQSLQDFRRAIQRTMMEDMEAAHPAFGRMNNEEWTQLHLRHSEMHLSFAVPE